MANLIDYTYFKGELVIPNLIGSQPINTANQTALLHFINIYEPEWMYKLLTSDLYEAFIAGLAEETPDEKWTTLKGKIVNESLKTSPIVGYVYYHWMRDKITQSTGLGEVSANAENATSDVNTAKMTKAYNDMVNAAKIIWDWIIDNIETYTEFDQTALFPFAKINAFNF